MRITKQEYTTIIFFENRWIAYSRESDFPWDVFNFGEIEMDLITEVPKDVPRLFLVLYVDAAHHREK